MLLANVGTPAAPTPAAVRRYLKEFLTDPRVVELPRLPWWLVLHLVVLTTRPRRSARLYRRVWTAEGSPLLVVSRRQAAALQLALRGRLAAEVPVALGMRYGTPSLAAALEDLWRRGCRRLLVLPLYPQYASPTTGSTVARVCAEVTRWRWVPELRTVGSYHDHPGYVAALAASLREAWASGGPPVRLLLSFHGLPARAVQAGDPYPEQCRTTADLLLGTLGWPAERAVVAFQSRFGGQRWLAPATEEVLRQWGQEGVKAVDVLCPGFAADCPETLEEIAQAGREVFLRAGGERFRYIPALNDRPDHIAALADIVWRHTRGWVGAATSEGGGL